MSRQFKISLGDRTKSKDQSVPKRIWGNSMRIFLQEKMGPQSLSAQIGFINRIGDGFFFKGSGFEMISREKGATESILLLLFFKDRNFYFPKSQKWCI